MRTTVDQPLIRHLTVILLFQLIGETIVRGLNILAPGPVIGMVLFLCLLVLRPKYAQEIRTTATGLLSHLSLLFVPAGVGVVGHINALGTDALILLLVIVFSTALTILTTAYVFSKTLQMMGQSDD
jgi:holin-like protein